MDKTFVQALDFADFAFHAAPMPQGGSATALSVTGNSQEYNGDERSSHEITAGALAEKDLRRNALPPHVDDQEGELHNVS